MVGARSGGLDDGPGRDVSEVGILDGPLAYPYDHGERRADAYDDDLGEDAAGPPAGGAGTGAYHAATDGYRTDDSDEDVDDEELDATDGYETDEYDAETDDEDDGYDTDDPDTGGYATGGYEAEDDDDAWEADPGTQVAAAAGWDQPFAPPMGYATADPNGNDDAYDYDEEYEDEYVAAAVDVADPLPGVAAYAGDTATWHLPGPAATALAPSAQEPTIWAPGTAPGAWVPLGRPRFDHPIHHGLTGPAQVRTRRRNLSVFSLAGITDALLLSYGVTAAVLAAFTAALARRRSALDSVRSASERLDALRRSGHLIDVTSLGLAAMLATTLATSMMWCALAARNQRLLGAGDSSPSPAGAALGWIVPVVNLVLPFRSVSVLTAGPTGQGDGGEVRLVARWWVCWLASVGAAVYAMRAAAALGPSVDSSRDVTFITLLALLATACFLLCFSQAITVFRAVARLQHDLAVEQE